MTLCAPAVHTVALFVSEGVCAAQHNALTLSIEWHGKIDIANYFCDFYVGVSAIQALSHRKTFSYTTACAAT